MPKRFTDTEIWEKEWFTNLKPIQRDIVRYVRDRCDLAGFWIPNLPLMAVRIGQKIKLSDILSIDSGKQFSLLENGKIYCLGFIEFQYGFELTEKSPVHKKVLQTIRQNGLTIENLNTLSNSLLNTLSNSPIDIDKDKEEEKEKDDPKKNEPQKEYSPDVLGLIILTQQSPNLSKMKSPLTHDEAERLLHDFKKDEVVDILRDMENKPDLSKKYVSTNLTVRSWMKIRKTNPIKKSERQQVSQSFRGNLSGG